MYLENKKMLKYSFWIFGGVILFLSSCIGDDIVDDTIEPEVRVSNLIDTLGIGQEYQFEALFFNNIGQQEQIPMSWESSQESIISMTNTGLARGLDIGMSTIRVSAMIDGMNYESSFELNTGTTTTTSNLSQRKGEIKTTSSYLLEGDFVLELESEGGLVLNISENYQASTALPGLYVYLSNNPSSISEALEIGEVQVFQGAHSYQIGGDVGIFDFNYVLYYCKPFNVKVGDGKIED